MSRTYIKWDKHELTILKNSLAIIYQFKQPNMGNHAFKLICTCGITAVTGDWGNWIFCREFHPGGDKVSDGYWVEKLEISSCQKPYKYSPEEVEKKIKERVDELEEYGYEGEQLIQIKEYYENCLNYIEDEYEYIAAARDYPNFADGEYCFIEGKELNFWLRAIFDGFDEMCDRIKYGNYKTEEK